MTKFNRTYAIDIETIPNPEMLHLLPEPEVALGNLKDPIKIEAKIADAKQKQIDNMALNPLYGKICCIGYYSEEDGKGCYIDNDETKIITNVMSEIFDAKNRNSTQIITWNGCNFDVPFIFKRALLLGIPTTTYLGMWVTRYSNTPHADLMQIWSNWSFQGYTKLDDMSSVLLGEKKIDIDFRTFPELMKTQGGMDAISEYCLEDCRLTYSIFKKFNGVLFY
ncbi:MAG TPA: ribonuclease H-like domain-containing protein [Bacteroidales bacterium]|nr:ribonuclease H-like domain-containing protein [Bacteroidales bacterium]